MCYRKYLRSAIGFILLAVITLPLPAQDAKEPKKDAGVTGDQKKSGEADMMAMMMEMAKPGSNHKQMQQLVGTWAYEVKWWMSPDSPPSQSSGTTVTKAVMDGRYLISDHIGKMKMPGSNGVEEMEFKGMAIEGYDNAKKKFVASWIDNMGTGIMNLEGTYDAPSKTLTYQAEYEPIPGMKTKIRELVKITDQDHHTLEFFEDRGGKEVKTMEINYTRKS